MVLPHSTFGGHVTSSVTWPFDSPYAISYWWSFGPLSLTVSDIFNVKSNGWCHLDTNFKQSSRSFSLSSLSATSWDIQGSSAASRTNNASYGCLKTLPSCHWLIGSRTCAFDWHQDRWWPWMNLTCYKFEFSRNFAVFRRFGSQQRLNEWIKIDPYRQRQNCSPLNVFFSGV